MLEQDYQEGLEKIINAGDDSKKKDKARKEIEKIAAKAVKALGLKVKDAADIAIFGRMVADDHSLMVEGAGLFSHALSTHAVSNEIDFFTAVDDLNKSGDEGAGHMGTLEFSSACYYRYIGLNLDLLKDEKHLSHFSEEEFKSVVTSFLRASINAVPNARKNSMFGFTRPGYILGLRREGQPLSLVNAFEKPIHGNKGFMEVSKSSLCAHWDELKSLYSLSAKKEAELPPENLDDFINGLTEEV